MTVLPDAGKVPLLWRKDQGSPTRAPGGDAGSARGESAIRTTLHIGGEKTGTTSLQYFLSWNRDPLLKQGILYSAAPGRVNHVLLAIYGSPEVNTEDLKTQVGIGTQSALNAMLSTLPDALEAEVAESGCREILLSNEHCSSRLLSETSVKRIRELIARFSSEVRVVMYLRRQDELLLSAYSTAVSSGRTVPLQIPSGRDLQYYDFAEILDRWAKIFGEENITARVYDRETLVGGDVIDDFADLIGAKSPPGGFVRPAARLNSSLDSRVTELLRVRKGSAGRRRPSDHGVPSDLAPGAACAPIRRSLERPRVRRFSAAIRPVEY
jgi:hypothetical protein